MDNSKQVILTEDARDDLDHIAENYVFYTGSFDGARQLIQDIYDKISLIGFIPEAAGRLRDDGTREAFERQYRIVYRIENDKVYILTVLHSRMLYPRPS